MNGFDYRRQREREMRDQWLDFLKRSVESNEAIAREQHIANALKALELEMECEWKLVQMSMNPNVKSMSGEADYQQRITTALHATDKGDGNG